MLTSAEFFSIIINEQAPRRSPGRAGKMVATAEPALPLKDIVIYINNGVNPWHLKTILKKEIK